jgi:hypothetical protein
LKTLEGMLRHIPFMEAKTYGVVLSIYGDDRAKPTDIWTNSTKWSQKEMCRNYKYDKEGNIIEKHCHHESTKAWSETDTKGKKKEVTDDLKFQNNYVKIPKFHYG